jgi:hypothetical protein
MSFNVLVQVPSPSERALAAAEGTHVAFGSVLVDKFVLDQMRFQFEASLAQITLVRSDVYLWKNEK